MPAEKDEKGLALFATTAIESAPMSEDEVMTLWVRLKGEDRERAKEMRDKEKRSYASLMRIALAHYYDTHHADNVAV